MLWVLHTVFDHRPDDRIGVETIQEL